MKPEESAIRATLEILVEPGAVFEVRALYAAIDAVDSGYYNDLGLATQAILKLERSGRHSGIYVTLNRLKPEILARCANRIQERVKGGRSTVGRDIERRRWLLVDFDAERARGISATEEERKRAIARAELAMASLMNRGWPAPVFGSSGNGAHLLFRIDLPNDKESETLVGETLAAMGREFGDEHVKVDLAVKDPNRITRLYGTTARKGDNTPDRPYRRSAIVSVPNDTRAVPQELLAALAMATPEVSGTESTARGEFDVEVFLRNHGLGVKRREPYEGGDRFILEACPFDAGHDGSRDAAVLRQPGGKLGFKCFHDGCAGRGWKELREKFDPVADRERSNAGIDQKVGVDAQVAVTVMPTIERASVVALEPPESIEYDIEAILPSTDAPALIFGPPASLKSWLALAICDAVVRGEPFLGLATRRRPSALYLNLDAGAKTFRNRIRAVSDAPGFDFVTLSAGEFNGVLLRTLLAQYRGGFVVVDCLSSIYAPDTKTDPAHAMRVFVDDLRSVFAEFHCGGLIVDHPHRPKERGELGDYHGSIQKEAAFRTMWSIAAEAPDENGGPRRTRIVCRKLSEGAMFSPIDVDVEFGERVTMRRAHVADAAARSSIVETKILEWGRGQVVAFSRRTVAEKVRGQRAVAVRNAFDDLVTAGKIVPTGTKRGNGVLFRVADGESGSVSGTHPDSLDSLGSSDVPRGGSGPLSLIGDPPIGTHSGTHSVARISPLAVIPRNGTCSDD